MPTGQTSVFVSVDVYSVLYLEQECQLYVLSLVIWQMTWVVQTVTMTYSKIQLQPWFSLVSSCGFSPGPKSLLGQPFLWGLLTRLELSISGSVSKKMLHFMIWTIQLRCLPRYLKKYLPSKEVWVRKLALSSCPFGPSSLAFSSHFFGAGCWLASSSVLSHSWLVAE